MTLFSSLQTLLALGLLFRHEQSMSGQWEPPRDIGNKSIGRDTLSSPRITNSEDHVNWSCYETTLWLQKKCHLQNRFSVSRKPKLSAIDSGLLDPSNLSDMLDNPNWFTSQVRDWRNILLFDRVCAKIPLWSRLLIYTNTHIIGLLSGFDLIYANHLAWSVRFHDPYSSADCKTGLDTPPHPIATLLAV